MVKFIYLEGKLNSLPSLLQSTGACIFVLPRCLPLLVIEGSLICYPFQGVKILGSPEEYHRDDRHEEPCLAYEIASLANHIKPG